MDKLTRVLKVRKQQEDDSAAALARSQQAHAQAQAQQGSLTALTAEYREQHASLTTGGIQRFRQFQLFYAQLTAAVNAQQDVIDKLAESEAQDARVFVSRHKDRRALELLLEQRDLAHKTRRLKAERRSQGRPQPKPLSKL